MSSGAIKPQETAPQLQSSVEALACSQAAGAKSSSSSEYVTCASSQSKLPRHDQDGPYNAQEDAPQHQSPVEAPACIQEAGGDSSPSEYFTCVASPSRLPHSDVDGPCNTQEDAPQCQSPVEAPACSQAAGVNSFISEYSSFGCSPSKLSIPDEDENPIDHEHSLEIRAQEKGEEANSPVQPPALSRYPSTKTPEWLVAQDSGFRCMACCRVFPSLEVLQEHVECGVREGFSCHAFHNAMAHLKNKYLKDEQENQGGNM
ncbi:protein FAM170A-like [Pipistrellus kuhlii]|uniref:protein FAM170A-like n=1 Tax=Pipistrellus kuhlii TaxID=59472 RepID=UPI00174F1F2C|nr:protein FAM170A-like [Pipistrellus kuhlii]